MGDCMRRDPARYRTNRTLTALAFRENRRPAVTIPAGKTVKILGPGDDARLLMVEVEGERFQVFESDLADRCRAMRRANGRTAPRGIRTNSDDEAICALRPVRQEQSRIGTETEAEGATA